jgi:polyisoprenoid-binding protein YceI
MMKAQILIATLLAASATSAIAATYNIDPTHTYPSFEADHMGLSGMARQVRQDQRHRDLDRAAKTGALDVKIDAASIDFGLKR